MTWIGIVMVAGLVLALGSSAGFAQIGVPVLPKDAFPAFDNPTMLPAAEAEARRLVYERDMVIGVSRGREAKAYPITIMGVHELGNDTIDGVPIVVTW